MGTPDSQDWQNRLVAEIQYHNAAQKTRAAQKAGALQLAAQEHQVSGEIRVSGGSGECICPLIFPVKFTHMPSFYSGVRFDNNAGVSPGEMPYANVVLLRFETEISKGDHRRAARTKLYTGATMGVVVHGPPGTSLIVNWNFAGIGIASVDDQPVFTTG